MTRKFKLVLRAGHCFLWLSIFHLFALNAATFDEQYSSLSSDLAGTVDKDFKQLILSSMREKKNEKALALFEEWLNVVSPEDPEVFYQAGEAAQMIQDFKASRSYYTVYLNKADLSSATAAKAANSVAQNLFWMEYGKRNTTYKHLSEYINFYRVKEVQKYGAMYWAKLNDYRYRNGNHAERVKFLHTCLESGLPLEELKSRYLALITGVANGYHIGTTQATMVLSAQIIKKFAADPELKALFSWKVAFYDYYKKIKKNPAVKPPLVELRNLLTQKPDYVSVGRDFHNDRFNYHSGAPKEHIHELGKVLNAVYAKSSPFVQLSSRRKGLPYGDDIAAKDKAFMDSLKKPDLKATLKRIADTNPKNSSYLRYALERQSWKVGNESWTGLDLYRYRSAMDRRVRNYKSVHPLKVALQKIIESDLAQGSINPHLVRAWYNAMGSHATTKEEAVLLVKIANSQAISKLTLDQRLWLEPRITPVLDQQASERLSAELTKLSDKSTADQVASVLKKAILDFKSAGFIPKLLAGPQLNALPQEVLANKKVYPLMIEYLSLFQEFHQVAQIWHNLFDIVVKNKDYQSLYNHGYCFWRSTQTKWFGENYQSMFNFTRDIATDNPSLAAMMARSRLMVSSVYGDRAAYGARVDNNGVSEVNKILTVALEKMGVVTIPVEKSDPAYPLFVSQQLLMAGNEGSAWETLLSSSEYILESHRQLRPSYLLWAIDKMILSNQSDEAFRELTDQLLNKCSEWVKAGGPFTDSNKVMLEILKGDIMRSKKRNINASKVYSDIIANKDYVDVLEQNIAYLRKAELEKDQKTYEVALETIEELIQKNVPEYKNRALYLKADILYENGNTEEAGDITNDILARDPTFNDAILLQGEIMIKDKDFRPNYQVPIGLPDSNKWITTGEKLSITLNDPSMAVSGGGTIIEIDVWSKMGDKEMVVLSQSGDSKTLFSGSIELVLGKPNPGDSFLQVIGDDIVQYCFNKDFAERMNITDIKVSKPVRVRSNGELFLSSKKLLSVAQQKLRDAKIMKAIRSNKAINIDGQSGRADWRKTNALNSVEKKDRTKAEYASMMEDLLEETKKQFMPPIKPGKPLYIRVIDDDKSRTDKVDTLSVRVRSSSGDSVNRVVLTETNSHSGVFDGLVQTKAAQPRASSSSDAAGANANSVISSKKSMAWKSKKIVKRQPVVFTIDLNDNVELGSMKIVSASENSPPAPFKIQTGMNVKSLSTIGRFPDNSLAVRPNHPSLRVVRGPNTPHTTIMDGKNVMQLKHYIENGVSRSYCKSNKKEVDFISPTLVPAQMAKNIKGPSQAFESLKFPEHMPIRRGRHIDFFFAISSFKASFYQSMGGIRKFRLVLGELGKKHAKAQLFGVNLLVDGVVIAHSEGSPLEGSIYLNPGIHTLEIISNGYSTALHSGRRSTLYSNIGEDNTMKMCPDSMFDPATMPDHAFSHKNNPVTAFTKKENTYHITFAKNSKTRIIRLIYTDKDQRDIAIDKIFLKKPDGSIVLPLESDYQAMARNDSLELLIGDQVSVLYKDDRFVGQKKESERKTKEKFMEVSYNNAKMALWPTTFISKLIQPPSYRRFSYGMEIPLAISDADIDITKQKAIEVKVIVSGSSTATNIKVPNVSGKGWAGVPINEFKTFFTPVDSISAEKQRRAQKAKQSGKPARPLINPIVVPKGRHLTLIYHDAENSDPGIPIDRMLGISHAVYQKPALSLSSYTTSRVKETFKNRVTGETEMIDFAGLTVDLTPFKRPYGFKNHVSLSTKRSSYGRITQRGRFMRTFHPVHTPPKGGFQLVQGLFAEVHVIAPHLVLKPNTTIQVYLQSESTRKRFAQGDLLEIEEGDDFAFDEDEIGDFDNSLEDDEQWNSESDIEEEQVKEKVVRIEQSEASKAIFNINMPGTVTLTIMDYKSQSSQLKSRKGSSGHARMFAPYTPEVSSEESPHSFGLKRPTGLSDGHFLGKALIRSGTFDPEKDQIARDQFRHLPLYVRPKDTVHMGFRYTDEHGQEQWLLSSAAVKTDGFLDVMNAELTENISKVYLGQRVYVRVADMGRDTSIDVDSCTVHLSSKSGVKALMTIQETPSENGGVFTGSLFLNHVRDKEEAKALMADPINHVNGKYDVSTKGFPVVYGDIVRIRYRDSIGVLVPYRQITIAQGASGEIIPYSKVFSDSTTAMNTQFAMADCFLELARRHLRTSLEAKANGFPKRSARFKGASDREFKQAKDLLSRCIESFKEPEALAQAQYNLGVLSYEKANAISARSNAEGRNEAFKAALTRFSKVTGRYASTSFASKAQFKKALTYEKLKEPDIAAAEYVKLAYKYPDSEFLGTAMARLGYHFYRVARGTQRDFDKFIKKNALKEVMVHEIEIKKNGIEEAKAEGIIPEGTDIKKLLEAFELRSNLNSDYQKSAVILSRMVKRFPGHPQAVVCGLTAGDCYRNGKMNDKAIEVYKVVASNEGFDSESRAEALYWNGKIFVSEIDTLNAYSVFMKITIDFPETKAAKWARAELAKKTMVGFDMELLEDKIYQK